MERKIDDAVEKFSNIQEEITRLESRALLIVREHLNLNTKIEPHWHRLIARAVVEMDKDLDSLEDEAEEQEEAGLEKEIKEFGQKYPEIKLSKEIANEMQAQGFSINETKRLVIIETPYADYPFNKKTGILLKPKV